MEDDNIIPYETSPTLTVKQAVMYMLGHRGEYSYVADTELMELDLYDYLYNLQEEADCAVGNAEYELWELRQNGDASPEAITIAEEKVKTTKAGLEKANELPNIAEKYRLLINHEITRVDRGKRSPLVLDKEKSGIQPHIITASFQEWLEGIELEDADGSPAPIDLPVDEDAFDKELSRKSAESLHVTLGLLVSMYAELRGGMFGTGEGPNVSSIAEAMAKYAKQRNGGHSVHGQGKESIKDRVELALSAMKSSI